MAPASSNARPRTHEQRRRVVENLPVPGNIGDDERNPNGHRFENDIRAAFKERRRHEHRCLFHEPPQIWNVAHDLKPAAPIVRHDPRLNLALERPLSTTERLHLIARQHHLERGQQHIDVLRGVKPPCKEHERQVGLKLLPRIVARDDGGYLLEGNRIGNDVSANPVAQNGGQDYSSPAAEFETIASARPAMCRRRTFFTVGGYAPAEDLSLKIHGVLLESAVHPASTSICRSHV